MKKYLNVFFPIILIFLVYLFTSLPQSRCSVIGIKILDDIFGLSGVGNTCKSEYLEKIPKEIVKEVKWKPHMGSKVKIHFNQNSNLTEKIRRECPVGSPVIVIIGQSNGANSGVSYQSQSEFRETIILENKINLNYNPFDDMCYELSEPVLGPTGNLDSITSSIGKKIRSIKTVLFINTSIGGSKISEWNELYAKHLNIILKKVLDKNFLKAIIWIQGESENHISSTKYYNNFLILKNLIFKDLKVKFQEVDFIITKSTYCGTKDDSLIREMNRQRKLIKRQFSNVKLLEITDNLNNSYRYDGCHFNRKGIEKISTEIAKKLMGNIVGTNQ